MPLVPSRKCSSERTAEIKKQLLSAHRRRQLLLSTSVISLTSCERHDAAVSPDFHSGQFERALTPQKGQIDSLFPHLGWIARLILQRESPSWQQRDSTGPLSHLDHCFLITQPCWKKTLSVPLLHFFCSVSAEHFVILHPSSLFSTFFLHWLSLSSFVLSQTPGRQIVIDVRGTMHSSSVFMRCIKRKSIGLAWKLKNSCFFVCQIPVGDSRRRSVCEDVGSEEALRSRHYPETLSDHWGVLATECTWHPDGPGICLCTVRRSFCLFPLYSGHLHDGVPLTRCYYSYCCATVPWGDPVMSQAMTNSVFLSFFYLTEKDHRESISLNMTTVPSL